MGYELELSGSPQGDHVTDLCTNGGFSALCQWLESLPKGDYPAISAFLEDGRFKGSNTLAIEVNRAIEDRPPGDEDVLHTANRLADLLGSGDPDETASVS